MRKFMLTQDDDCHWYVIPSDKSEEFWAWVKAMDGGDLPDSDAPEWLQEVGGAPSLVTFDEYDLG